MKTKAADQAPSNSPHITAAGDEPAVEAQPTRSKSRSRDRTPRRPYTPRSEGVVTNAEWITNERGERRYKVTIKLVPKQLVIIRLPPPEPKPARVAQLLAVAHRIDQMLSSGEIKSQAELAPDLEMSKARAGQILNLAFLAPDIQEVIAHLIVGEDGGEPVSEWELRPIARHTMWSEQRKAWAPILQRLNAQGLVK